jgi:hypothetical protein
MHTLIQSSFLEKKINVSIRRDHLHEDSFFYFQQLKTRRKIKVEFINEEGIDQGGLFCNWISKLVNVLLDSTTKIFEITQNGYYDIRRGKMNRHQLELCTFSGIIIGHSLAEKIAIIPRLSCTLIKTILDIPFKIKDLYSFDS